MPASVDLGEMYRAARHRIGALVGDESSGVQVAATPEWTVHDVVAHVAGVAADAVSGNMAGAPGPSWTAAQVERSRGRSVADLLAAWAGDGPRLEAVLSSPGGEQASAAVVDVHCHEADLRLALGMAPATPPDFLAWVARRLITGFDAAVAEHGLSRVEVSAGPYEIFRGRLGRRTVDEVRAYGWSTDPDPYLEAWFLFEPAAHSLGEQSL